MAMNFLEFEQPIAELEAKIEELKFLGQDQSVNITEEIKRLQSKSRALTSSIFANLSPWQITQLARHPQRPYTLDYVSMIFTDWHELHGDRMYGDDLAIVGGLARLEGTPVAAEVTRTLFQTAREYTEKFDVYAERRSFEWQQREDADPVVFTMEPLKPGRGRPVIQPPRLGMVLARARHPPGLEGKPRHRRVARQKKSIGYMLRNPSRRRVAVPCCAGLTFGSMIRQ